MDASRSGALFAERLVLVEGITEAALLRAFGRAWAAGDRANWRSSTHWRSCRSGTGSASGLFICWLSPDSSSLHRWRSCHNYNRPENPGDLMPGPTPPPWQQKFDTSDHVEWFWSKPTLETTLVAGNEALVNEALKRIGKDLNETPTLENVDALFARKSNRRFKGEFAFELAALADENQTNLVVPDQLRNLFDWLWEKHAPVPETPPVDPAAPVADR